MTDFKTQRQRTNDQRDLRLHSLLVRDQAVWRCTDCGSWRYALRRCGTCVRATRGTLSAAS